MAQALFKQAQLFEVKHSNLKKLQANYDELIIANYRDGILVDDAYYKIS